MDFRTLRAFVEVMRQGGFSQAGKTVFTTQSAVSKAVKQLETEIGIPLLDRTGPRPRLTAAGEIVFPRAVHLLADRESLLSEIGELQGLRRGSLRLGLPPVNSSALFAPLVAQYSALYPDIDIRLMEHGADRLEELLLAGEIDVAASLLPVRDIFEWQDVLCDSLVAVLSQGHVLARRKSVDLTALRDVPFILFSEGFAINRIVLDGCRRHGFEPDVAARSSQIDFIVELVAAGFGVGFMPQAIALEKPRAGVAVLRLAEPDTGWHLAQIWRRDAHLSPAARAWLQLSRSAHGHSI